MATNFPGSNDTFTEPASPGSTTLSSPGSGTDNHTEHHRDLGDAVEAMQVEATLLVHAHDGSTFRGGSNLAQVNTHQSPDTDTSTSALHHTIGTGANQAAAGDHVHSHPITLRFTAGTTFTKATYPGLYAVDVECVGGGGGSASTSATDSTHVGFASGGGGGAYVRGFILASALSSSETVSVGAGGTAGTGGGNGTDGGVSSFGAFLIAGGGGHGFSQSQLSNSSLFGSASGAGGTPSGSVSDAVKIKGEDGVFAVSTGTITYEGGLRGARSGGPYGTTCRFIGGIPWHTEFISSSGPVTGKSIGGGAAGAGTAPSSAARDGAAGSAGIVIVRLIF